MIRLREVIIDGTDIREVTSESLRGQMALVSQEVIFDQTVAENIACENSMRRGRRSGGSPGGECS